MVMRRLAKATLTAGGEVVENVADLIVGNLTRSKLKEYLSALRREIARRRVLVSVSGPADRGFRDELERRFTGRQTIISGDDTLGGGIRVRSGDDLMDASIKGLVTETIDRLKAK
jgi:hypothetical protein